jgi:hypothetical protein
MPVTGALDPASGAHSFQGASILGSTSSCGPIWLAFLLEPSWVLVDDQTPCGRFLGHQQARAPSLGLGCQLPEEMVMRAGLTA